MRKQEFVLRIHLIDALKSYRSEKAKRKNIPAYYIFTDKEMESIIDSKITSIEELKINHILSDIKVNLHGEEIIEVIRKH